MSDIRVLVVEDHPVVSKGLRDILNTSIGITVVGEANSGAQSLKMIEALEPDIVLLDMELPDMNGVAVLTRISEAGFDVSILGLSSYDDREYISQLLGLGAAGYLTKDEATDFIVEAVRGVARGESGWVSRGVAVRLTQIMQAKKEGKRDLTQRELQVLRLVVDGRTNAEISLNLEISKKTVEKHLGSIYRKLEVKSRVEAAVQAVRQNLL
jgi:DNA-binding NarL/FixJ family response regulator